jgi:signal peptidase I
MTQPTSQEAGSPTVPKPSRKKWLWDNVASLVFALILVFMVRSSIVEAFKIPSGSMIPTLLTGDHIFVNKFAYGIKVPFSDLDLDLPGIGRILKDPVFLMRRDNPKRGDIVVFRFPKDESFYYIKRVVGTPGDTVELRSKILYVNGQEVTKAPIPREEAQDIFDHMQEPRYAPENLEVFRENLTGREHLMMIDKTNFMSENFGPITVPAEQFFVMGDNRDFSNDSRFWGFVPFNNIKGRAMIIWLSLWFNLSEGQKAFRPWRIGTILH